jgi:carboxylate-amine ligase
MATGDGPRFGVEEEFLVVDPVTREVVPAAAAVVETAGATLGDRICGEITEMQVEARTDPCTTTTDLHAQLTEGRATLAGAAAARRLRVVATGTPVLGQVVPPPITRGPRQDRGEAMFRGLHDEVVICAVHVHVEQPDRERAVRISNHLRPHLPVLIALAANSPFWAGRDSGYASRRTLAWHRWPVAGPPPYFESAAHYDTLVATMLDAGALVDAGTLFWDVRLSAHQPTLEVRVADVPATAEESAALAALIRALVVTAAAAVDRGEAAPRVPAEFLRVAYWRAARDGMDGHGVDAHDGRLRPASELAARIVAAARPALGDLGDLDRVGEWVRRLSRDGDGAARQRRAAAAGGLTGTVDYLVSATAPVQSTIA